MYAFLLYFSIDSFLKCYFFIFFMEKTPFSSYKNGKIAQGCSLCVKGQKLVLFITGVCTRSCYFCPLSEQKFHQDVIYANERPITDMNDIIEEAKVSGAKGCGITGGDPLTKLERTLDAIRLLKKTFGTHFHIHLYTPLDLVDEEKIKKLEDAGLDEIRFHLDADDETLWHKIKIPTHMVKGVEVPCIPKKDLRKMLSFVRDHVAFINLNELEYADAPQNKLAELGFTTKDELSYGIAGSEEFALELLKDFPTLNIHYCTTRLKNSVQMMNRIALRAKHVKQPYDIVKGPALIRGAIYGNDDLETMHTVVEKLFHNDIDTLKKRLLCSKQQVIKFAKQLKKIGYRPEIVEELATYDQFEIESQAI